MHLYMFTPFYSTHIVFHQVRNVRDTCHYVIDTARTQLSLLANMQIFAYTSYPEHTPYNQGQPLLAILGKQPSCTQEEVAYITYIILSQVFR